MKAVQCHLPVQYPSYSETIEHQHPVGTKAPRRHAAMEFEDFGARFSVAVEDFSGSWSLLQEVRNFDGHKRTDSSRTCHRTKPSRAIDILHFVHVVRSCMSKIAPFSIRLSHPPACHVSSLILLSRRVSLWTADLAGARPFASRHLEKQVWQSSPNYRAPNPVSLPRKTYCQASTNLVCIIDAGFCYPQTASFKTSNHFREAL